MYLTLPRKNSIIVTFFISVALFLQSCHVQFVPSYDAQMATDITELAKKVDKLYLSMMEIPKMEDRTYDKFSAQYVDIEVELNSLLMRNTNKPLNANSTRINKIVIELFTKYKTKHQTDNKLSNGVIKNQRIFLADALNAMLVAEIGKKYGAPSEPAEN